MNRRDAVLALAAAVTAGCAQKRPLPEAAASALRSTPTPTPAPPSLPAAESLLRSAALQADAAILRQACEAMHPGLYRYNTPAEMAARFAALDAALAHDQPFGEAYVAFSQFAATVRCGHTQANVFNQPKAIREALLGRIAAVPFRFRWVGSRMIVSLDQSSDPSLRPGTEVLSIDGVPAAAILARLMTIARADGSNDAKRVAQLEVRGIEKIETFDLFLPLLFPQIGSRQTLLVRSPGAGGETRRITVAALTAAERQALRADAPAADGAAWTVDRSTPGMALLNMPTWALYDSPWDWKAFLQETFETLVRDDVPTLVIDLRANEGGDDCGNVVLAHLIESDLALPQYRRFVRYRKVPDALAPYLDTWDPSFKDWGAAALPFDDRFFRLVRYDDGPEGDIIRPAGPRYRGRVVVLVSATNSSATFQFAGAIQRTRLGTLVGQTTGGNRRGINGGAFFFLRLPHSRIELDLPLIAQFPSEPQPDEGIAPDVAVAATIDDIAAGRDVELDAAKRMLGLSLAKSPA